MDLSGRADPKTDMEGLRQAWIESKIRAAKAAAAPRGKKQPGRRRRVARRALKYLEEVCGDTDIRTSPGT